MGEEKRPSFRAFLEGITVGALGDFDEFSIFSPRPINFSPLQNFLNGSDVRRRSGELFFLELRACKYVCVVFSMTAVLWTF